MEEIKKYQCEVNGFSTIAFADGTFRIKAIFRNWSLKLNIYDCLFFSLKQFPSSIRENFQTLEGIFRAVQKGYQLVERSIKFTFKETELSIPLHQLPTIKLVLEEDANKKIVLEAERAEDGISISILLQGENTKS